MTTDPNRVHEYLADYARTSLKKMTLTKQLVAVLNYFRAAGYTQVSFAELEKALDLKIYEKGSNAAMLATKLKKMGYKVFTKYGQSYCRLEPVWLTSRDDIK